MNVFIPVVEDLGLESRVSSHFGSAPLFLVVETGSGTCRTIPNENQHHGHGGCQPLRAMAGENIGIVIVGGIGMGALAKLQAAGIRVFVSSLGTVEETLTALEAGALMEATPATSCAHHGEASSGHGHAEGGCGH